MLLTLRRHRVLGDRRLEHGPQGPEPATEHAERATRERAPAVQAKRNQHAEVTDKQGFRKRAGQERLLGHKLPVDSPLVQELPAKVECGVVIRADLVTRLEKVDAGQPDLDKADDDEAVERAEEAAGLEQNDEEAGEEEQDVHLDAEGEPES